MRRPWLAPLVPLYGAAVALRALGLRSASVHRLRWPVVSVGNLSMGGTGKTPFTIAIAKLLVREGMYVDVLSRGYGRESDGIAQAERVDAVGTAERFGDEPLLMARKLGVPVYVGGNRWLAGQLAEREASAKSGMQETGMQEIGVHLLDDGFQHRKLARQVDIVLVNSEDLSDALLPAGNLREGFGALKRAQVLAVPAGEEEAVARLERLGLGARLGQPVWRFRREMVISEPITTPVVAFCGIARPEQFFAGLEKRGIQVAARRAFADHFQYTRRDVEMLRQLAESTGAGALITTAKDFCRMGALSGMLDAGRPVLAADVEIVLEEEAGAVAWLMQKLGLRAATLEKAHNQAPAGAPAKSGL